MNGVSRFAFRGAADDFAWHGLPEGHALQSSAVDETSGDCSNDEYMYVLQTVERTCGPTQQLFDRHEQLLKQVSA